MKMRSKIVAAALTGLILWAETSLAAAGVSEHENSLLVCVLLIFCASSIAFQLVPGLIRIFMILRRRYIDSSLGDGSDS